MSSYEVRVPEALILAPFQPWVKMVWISARSFQGAGDTCYASLRMIGERSVTDTGNAMDKGQVSRGLAMLEKGGFIERVSGRHIRCLTPEIVDPQSTFSDDPEPLNVDSQSTNVDPQSTMTTPPNVDPQSTSVDPQSTAVDPQSTPSENQQGKPTRKTNKRVKPDFPDDAWQMVFALTALDRLEDLELLPASLARKRAATLQAFASEFDKLRRLDEFDPDTIRQVMGWLLSPTNWWVQTANFRSVLKLRKPHKDGGTYFEHFLSQLRSNGHGKTKPSNHTSYTEADTQRILELAFAGAASAGS